LPNAYRYLKKILCENYLLWPAGPKIRPETGFQAWQGDGQE
jgi:hypothetical protein